MAASRPGVPPTAGPSDVPIDRGRRLSFFLFTALFAVIIVGVLALLAAGVMSGGHERQFELAITPSGGEIGQGERLDVEVRITVIREGLPFFEHDLPITLRAEGVPAGIYVTFDPAAGIPDPEFGSRMLIAHAGAAPGSYSFTVHAAGSDGRGLSLPFRLEVTGPGAGTPRAR
ncbi:MAG: hypothetical protein GXY82_03550 [Methanospirillum sp.]|nr:hypothetical protein [Methanospirillum sp.]